MRGAAGIGRRDGTAIHQADGINSENWRAADKNTLCRRGQRD
jgi:hypothetical protein